MNQYLYSEEEKNKFAGTYRSHVFVDRDFEINDAIIGGGYLTISTDMESCSYKSQSEHFGPVPDPDVVVNLANKEFFDNE